jgi:hypothetical protein
MLFAPLAVNGTYVVMTDTYLTYRAGVEAEAEA